MLVRAAMSEMAAVFWGSAKMPFSLMLCPRNVTCLLLNSHFSALRVTPAFWIHSNAPLSHLSHSGPFPKLGCHQWVKELHWAHQVWRWFVPGSVEVSMLIESARICCWHLASWRQQHAPESWARVSSTWGERCVSQSMLSLKGFRLTQM